MFASYTTDNQNLYVHSNILSGKDITVNVKDRTIQTNVVATTFKLAFTFGAISTNGSVSNSTEIQYNLTVDSGITASVANYTARNATSSDIGLVFDENGVCFKDLGNGTTEIIFQNIAGRKIGVDDEGTTVQVLVKSFSEAEIITGFVRIK